MTLMKENKLSLIKNKISFSHSLFRHSDDKHLTGIDIHNMHLSFGWDGVGYHKIIQRDGTVKMVGLSIGLALMLRVLIQSVLEYV